jgi:hypothetical protein
MKKSTKEDLTGRINGWTCDICGVVRYVVHIHHGVTPMFLSCKEALCKGMGISIMYPDPPAPQHVIESVQWEWFQPTKSRLKHMTPEMQEHIKRGGLDLRPLTDEGRAVIRRSNA